MSLKLSLSKILIILVATFLLVSVAYAHETTDDHAQEHAVEALMAQINQLLEDVARLQAQVAGNAPEFTSFSRSLTVGDKGEDVKELQKFLNSDNRTTIAFSGPGSPGNETNYFGNLTAEAVKKFQELYYEDVLFPVSLTFGTGYVGPSTISKLNELHNEKEYAHSHGDEEHSHTHYDDEFHTHDEFIEEEIEFVDVPTRDDYKDEHGKKDKDDETLSVEESKDEFEGVIIDGSTSFYVVGLSQYYVQSGDVIEVGGAGFSKDMNKIYFGDKVLENLEAKSPTLLSFEIPTLEPGIYQVTFSNGYTESLKIDIVITSDNTIPVVIESVMPDVISHGTLVTVYGNGFTDEGNLIFMDSVEFRDLNSDGEKITFTFKRPSFNRDNFTQDALDALGPAMIAQLESFDMSRSPGIERETQMGVINTNGRSNFFKTTFR